MRLSRGETEMHKTLKKEACRYLFRVGYRAVAAEVRVHPLGIIDAVGVGRFGAFVNHLKDGRDRTQTCFIECKASRGDFLRDLTHEGQLELALMERRSNKKRRGRRTLRQRVGLGKFDACLLQPMANLHYVLAPVGLLKKEEIPPRWGLLVLGEGGITVVKAAVWQEQARPEFVECAIARTLTGDIFRADTRAMESVNREIANQQADLARRIRNLESVMSQPIEKQQKLIDEQLAMIPPTNSPVKRKRAGS